MDGYIELRTESMKENKMQKKALVTGASSGIGLAIAEKLVQEGYEVYGLGRDFSKSGKNKADMKLQVDIDLPTDTNLQAGTDLWSDADLQADTGLQEDINCKVDKLNVDEPHMNTRFHKITCDLCNTQKLIETIQSINKDHDISLLINNAGVGYYGLHEELNPQKISQMVRTNLEAPMIITNLLLRDLKKNAGIIVNTSSVTAGKSNPHGCAYGATKAGLTSFSHSLFDEARKYGVKVINIEPDMTATNLYRNADFTADEEVEARLLPEEIADAVWYAVSQRAGLVVTDIVVKPQLHRIKRKPVR